MNELIEPQILATLELPRQMGKWKVYEHYKDSAIEWLGKIPEHWEVRRLKYTVLGCQNGIWGDEPTYNEKDIVCIRVADFDRLNHRVSDRNLTIRSIQLSQRQNRVLRQGDLLIEKSGGGDLQPVGTVILYDLEIPAVCSNFIARMQVARGYHAPFLCYLYTALYEARINTVSIKQNTGIQNLDTNSYLSEKVSLPTIYEQRSITAFLDRETTKINELIAKKERMIELLQEQRTAIISQAVTKGLNPDVPMKDSGIEWLGEIPVHWEVRRLAMATRKITNGYVGPTRDIFVDNGIRYLQSLHIKDGEIRFNKPYYVTKEWSNEHTKSILQEGDVLIVQTGAETGQCCAVPKEFEGCNCHALIIVQLKNILGSGFYLSAILRSHYGENVLLRARTGALHPHLECGKIREISVTFPPIEEQELIMQYINHETARIDRLISRIQDGIKKLKEYSAALISAAVTGKIDVREEVADMSAEDAAI